MIIAIDGPAGSGKSTLGKKLADCLGYLFFDTGVMYRAVTWAALQRGLDIRDEEAITALAETIRIDILPPSKTDQRSYDVWVGAEDITWKIRSPEVEAAVSPVSVFPGVRKALTEQQRRIGMRGNVVMVGRDIGTVVLPDADFKIYLDASVEERALRRYQELISRSQPASLDAILAVLKERDEIDSQRKVAPLKPAEDAVIIDSNHLDADQVLGKAKALMPDCQA